MYLHGKEKGGNLGSPATPEKKFVFWHAPVPSLPLSFVEEGSSPIILLQETSPLPHPISPSSRSLR